MQTVDYRLTTEMCEEISTHEGLVAEAYKDSVGVWTWSIGITSQSGHDVERYIDNPATIDRCVEVYIWALDLNYLQAVQRAMQSRPLTLNQLTASLSFHWNTGAIERASWVGYFLNGDMAEAERRFMQWDSPPEIIERRKREADLLFRNIWSGDGKITHYTRVTNSSTPDWSSGVRISIRDELERAISAHYGPTDPLPPVDPPVEPKPPDNQYAVWAADIRQTFPSLDQRDAEKYLLENHYSISGSVYTRAALPIAQRALSSPPPSTHLTPPQQPNEAIYQSPGFWGALAMIKATGLYAYLGVDVEEQLLQQAPDLAAVALGVVGAFLALLSKRRNRR